MDYSKLYNSNIAVIGNGYIGRNLFKQLKSIDNTNSILVKNYNRGNLNQIKNQTFDYVFCCTGNTGNFRTKIWETIESNISVLNFIINNVKISRSLVVLSSTRLYGFDTNENIIFNENELINSGNHLNLDFIYDGTKKMMESILFNQFNKYSFNIAICRISNVYGEFSQDDLDDSTYLKFILKNKIANSKFTSNIDVKGKKDFIFIEDLINGLILSAINSSKSDIYNIASGKSFSWLDWFDLLNLKPNVLNENVAYYSNIDISKAKINLGFEPKYFLNNINFNQIIRL
jgi:GDP-4-dehydro-6-deoxy-D-mannose reductase